LTLDTVQGLDYKNLRYYDEIKGIRLVGQWEIESKRPAPVYGIDIEVGICRCTNALSIAIKKRNTRQ
jgi:hypothetical protein